MRETQELAEETPCTKDCALRTTQRALLVVFNWAPAGDELSGGISMHRGVKLCTLPHNSLFFAIIWTNPPCTKRWQNPRHLRAFLLTLGSMEAWSMRTRQRWLCPKKKILQKTRWFRSLSQTFLHRAQSPAQTNVKLRSYPTEGTPGHQPAEVRIKASACAQVSNFISQIYCILPYFFFFCS